MPEEKVTQSERLAALYQISMRLGSTLDLQELLDRVIDAVIQLTHAERGFIVLVDEWGRLKTMAARNVDSQPFVDDEIPVSRTIVQRVVATGEPILTSNAQDDARFADRASVIGYQFRSIMCAPLRARGRINGAIFVDNRMLAGVFGENDLELLSMFANQTAMAIDNARLFQQTDQALARRVEELALFQRIDRDLHESLDLAQTLDLVLDWAIRLTKADVGAVGVIDEDQPLIDDEPHVRLLVRTDEPDTAAIEYLLAMNHASLVQGVKSRRAVQLYDIPAEQSIFGDLVAAQLVVPVILDYEPIGIIFLETNKVTRFLEEDVEFAKRLADRAAVAIGNSRLYQKLKDTIEARSTFVSLMTHELRLPLTSIRGYADLLSKELVGSLTEQQRSFVEIIRRNVIRMNELLSNLSDINRLESKRLPFDIQQFDWATVLEELLDSVRDRLEEKHQQLKFDRPSESAAATGDPTRCAQVVGFLVDNAHKYTPDGGEITVRLGSHRADGQLYVRVDVEDNGVGMTDDDRRRAFHQFFRSTDPPIREQVGWGLGLTVAQRLSEAMGGYIALTSTHGQGTTASVFLPRDSQI